MIGLATAWSAVANAKNSILTGLAVAAICLPLGYCKGSEAARDKAEAQRALANVVALKTANTANEAAAVERVDDALAIAKQKDTLTDAISETPDTAPDSVRVELGCARLRRQGSVDIPAVCKKTGNP